MFSVHSLTVTTDKKNKNATVPTATTRCQMWDKFRGCFGKPPVGGDESDAVVWLEHSQHQNQASLCHILNTICKTFTKGFHFQQSAHGFTILPCSVISDCHVCLERPCARGYFSVRGCQPKLWYVCLSLFSALKLPCLTRCGST